MANVEAIYSQYMQQTTACSDYHNSRGRHRDHADLHSDAHMDSGTIDRHSDNHQDRGN